MCDWSEQWGRNSSVPYTVLFLAHRASFLYFSPAQKHLATTPCERMYLPTYKRRQEYDDVRTRASALVTPRRTSLASLIHSPSFSPIAVDGARNYLWVLPHGDEDADGEADGALAVHVHVLDGVAVVGGALVVGRGGVGGAVHGRRRRGRRGRQLAALKPGYLCKKKESKKEH